MWPARARVGDGGGLDALPGHQSYPEVSSDPNRGGDSLRRTTTLRSLSLLTPIPPRTATMTHHDVIITSPTEGHDIDSSDKGSADVPARGTGNPVDDVVATLDDGDSKTVTVGEDGNWSVTFKDVAPGSHRQHRFDRQPADVPRSPLVQMDEDLRAVCDAGGSNLVSPRSLDFLSSCWP